MFVGIAQNEIIFHVKMTPPAQQRQKKIKTIAETLVNQRVMRNGSPPLSNPLEILPEKLHDEVMGDAKAVYNALEL